MAPLSMDKPLPPWVIKLANQRALLAPIGFILLLTVIVVPLHPVLMDLLIAVNISIAVIMLMTTMYIGEALDFSVFPSLLLGTTLFRLVLNIASTRLILTADASTPDQAIGVAGKVISAFGAFVAGGSPVVGIIIFLILVVVQFIVITKGATRISEVAARFTLDAMPGKQMAIDADVNAGILSEQEAKDRRDRISREADFFGAMDGASKFVRGDAIAGIIITVINIVGGFAIGAIDKGWSIGETARVFTILTIGDGLTSQIPSFVIAIAAALIVTRSGSRHSLGSELTTQLTSRPIALVITAAFLLLIGLTPLPTMPLMTIGGVIGLAALLMTRQSRAAVRLESEREAAVARAARPDAPPVEDLLKVDTMELEIGYGLVSLVDGAQGGDLLDRISAIRRQLAAEMGFVLPPVRIRDNMTLTPNAYRLRIRGNPVGDGETRPGLLLAMDSGIVTGRIGGEPTREPAFGLEAWWIEPGLKSRAETMNYTVVDPTSVLTTHLAELARSHAAELLTREEVAGLVEQLKARAPKLVEQTIPDVITLGDLQKVLQGLLEERVPVRDLETIVETLADWAPRTKDTEILVEYVRNALRRTICQQVAVPAEPGSGRGPRLVCVTLDPAFEDVINGYIERSAVGTTLSMPATIANAVARCVLSALEPVTAAGHQPVVIASPQVRAQVRQIVQPHLPGLTVLGYNEIIPGIEVESMALVAMPEAEAAFVA